jgi:hypothetical protein
MTYASGSRTKRFVLLCALLPAVSAQGTNYLSPKAQADAVITAEEICMPKGTYRTSVAGTTVFSRDKTCFSRPVTSPYPWEKLRAKKSARDPFNGARVVQYDYHDALYHCAKRDMRLPTVEELSALFVYVNGGSNAGTGASYAIVARGNDSRHPGGHYGWGGGRRYWSHTFAGKGLHKVIDLSNGRVGADHDVHGNYVSCVGPLSGS